MRASRDQRLERSASGTQIGTETHPEHDAAGLSTTGQTRRITMPLDRASANGAHSSQRGLVL